MKEKKKQNNEPKQADAITKTEKEDTLLQIGEIAGVTRDDIRNFVRTKKTMAIKNIVLCALSGLTTLSYLTYISQHYQGTSIQDFEMVEQVMKGFFGRFF
jgi:hypothetical protein